MYLCYIKNADKQLGASLNRNKQLWQRISESRDGLVTAAVSSETGSYGVFTLNYEADNVRDMIETAVSFRLSLVLTVWPFL
jgi:hypothetical protein